MTFSLEAFAINDTAELIVKTPDGEDSPLVISVYGRDSKQAKSASIRAVHRREAVTKRLGKDRLPDEATIEKLNSINIEFLADVTAGWTGVDVKFSRDAAIEMYTKFAIIREQVDDFCKERENFTKKP